MYNAVFSRCNFICRDICRNVDAYMCVRVIRYVVEKLHQHARLQMHDTRVYRCMRMRVFVTYAKWTLLAFLYTVFMPPAKCQHCAYCHVVNLKLLHFLILILNTLLTTFSKNEGTQ